MQAPSDEFGPNAFTPDVVRPISFSTGAQLTELLPSSFATNDLVDLSDEETAAKKRTENRQIAAANQGDFSGCGPAATNPCIFSFGNDPMASHEIEDRLEKHGEQDQNDLVEEFVYTQSEAQLPATVQTQTAESRMKGGGRNRGGVNKCASPPRQSEPEDADDVPVEQNVGAKAKERPRNRTKAKRSKKEKDRKRRRSAKRNKKDRKRRQNKEQKRPEPRLNANRLCHIVTSEDMKERLKRKKRVESPKSPHVTQSCDIDLSNDDPVEGDCIKFQSKAHSSKWREDWKFGWVLFVKDYVLEVKVVDYKDAAHKVEEVDIKQTDIEVLVGMDRLKVLRDLEQKENINGGEHQEEEEEEDQDREYGKDSAMASIDNDIDDYNHTEYEDQHHPHQGHGDRGSLEVMEVDEDIDLVDDINRKQTEEEKLEYEDQQIEDLCDEVTTVQTRSRGQQRSERNQSSRRLQVNRVNGQTEQVHDSHTLYFVNPLFL